MFIFFLQIPDMLTEDPEMYFETFWVTPTVFEKLLHQIGPHIIRQNAVRESISPSERLHATLKLD